ncbi:Lysosomal Pro-X carboxypeptidase [Apodemus speciosus]|uniref:Lysosomal Pro-X carboxypeptidase n=1 Tax=Apodemus speciosus TaxID=105296 RepID=A0ABQ0EZ61_APOSI
MVDHFGFFDTRTFKQRYLVADKHWQKDGGSILFYTGNEGDIVWFCNNTGFMWDVAEELKAMLVFAEHRYYGESLPFGQDSFKDSKHLNFLTSEQALADFAELIRHLKKTIPGAKGQPVIAIGGSYGGMLAAWFRMKYPHMVVGALAASAPIWQLDGMAPCGEFMKIVTKDFSKSGPHCIGLQWLTNTLHLCSPLTSEKIPTLKGWIAETWVDLAMVNYPYACNFLQPLPAWPIKEVCQYLKNPNVSDTVLLQNIFQALNVYYNYSGQAECLNISQTATSSLGSLGWSFQACTEMVMPFCANGVDDMFEPFLWDLETYSNDCFNQWGVKPRPYWMTTMYGGKDISSHSNIIFRVSLCSPGCPGTHSVDQAGLELRKAACLCLPNNGDLDPWSGGGVTEDISDTLVAINIPEGAHHLDLRAHTAYDPQSVLLSRLSEVKHMKKWIADFYSGAK